MKTLIRASAITLSAVLAFIALSGPGRSVIAQQQEHKLKTTVVADNKYGQGGTLETASDKLKLVREEWKDAKGKIRESHYIHYDANNKILDEAWYFSPQEKEVVYWPSEKTLRISKNTSGPGDQPFEYIWDVDRAGADKFIEKIETQFAKEGTTVVHDVDTPQVKPPELRPANAVDQSTKPEKTNSALPCEEAMKKVGLRDAAVKMRGFIDHIEERKQAMQGMYYYAGAVTTLEKAFKVAGITESIANADSWGKNGIGFAWYENARAFYLNHVEILNQSLQIIETRGYATKGELVELENGMKNWDADDQRLLQHFEAFVGVYMTEGKIYDEKADYLKKYYAKLSQLQGKRPFPAHEIDVLNRNMSRDVKTFDDRIKQIENGDQQKISDEIKKLGAKRVFAVVKKVPGC